MKYYWKAMDGVYFVVEKLAIIFLIATMTLLFIQTCLRFGLNFSLAWAEELCRYMCIWMSFLGSGIGIRYGIHVGFDLLKNRLPKRARRILETLVNGVVLLFSFVLFQGGLQLMRQAQFQTSSSLGISMSYVYGSLMAGAALVALFSLEGIVRGVVRREC